MASIERIPGSMIEASGDLGADPATTWRRVILPLARPGLAATAIFCFILSWNELLFALIMTETTHYMLHKVFEQT